MDNPYAVAIVLSRHQRREAGESGAPFWIAEIGSPGSATYMRAADDTPALTLHALGRLIESDPIRAYAAMVPGLRE